MLGRHVLYRIILTFLATPSVAVLPGCIEHRKAVIQPSGKTPTTEETKAYEREVEKMMAERD